MFTHYESVVKNIKPAKYLTCKRIREPTATPIGFDDAMRVHERLAAKFAEFYEKAALNPCESEKEGFDGLNYLEVKKIIVERVLEKCILCERRCQANRLSGATGFCGVNKTARVSSYFLHMGEESQLIPSGTVFFSGCTFRCAYNTRL